MANGQFYVMGTVASNVFTNTAGSNIIIEATDHSFTYNNVYDQTGANLFLSQKRITTNLIDVPDTGSATYLAKLNLYKCEEDGTCVLKSGYAIDGNKFYSFTNGASAAIYPATAGVNDVASCSGKIGHLINDYSGNYLCLDSTGELKVNLNDYGYYAYGTTAISANGIGTVQRIIKVTQDFIMESEDFDGKLYFYYD